MVTKPRAKCSTYPGGCREGASGVGNLCPLLLHRCTPYSYETAAAMHGSWMALAEEELWAWDSLVASYWPWLYTIQNRPCAAYCQGTDAKHSVLFLKAAHCHGPQEETLFVRTPSISNEKIDARQWLSSNHVSKVNIQSLLWRSTVFGMVSPKTKDVPTLFSLCWREQKTLGIFLMFLMGTRPRIIDEMALILFSDGYWNHR